MCISLPSPGTLSAHYAFDWVWASFTSEQVLEQAEQRIKTCLQICNLFAPIPKCWWIRNMFFEKDDMQINDFNNFISMPKDRFSFSSRIFGDQKEGKHLTQMSTRLRACLTHSYTLGNMQPLSSDNNHPTTFLEILEKIITTLGYVYIFCKVLISINKWSFPPFSPPLVMLESESMI